jgi:uncharacterized membrane protein YdjX (TVP38/TMEM64 family)
MNKLFKTRYVLILLYLILIIFFYNLFYEFQLNKNTVIEFLLNNKEKFDFYIDENLFRLFLIFFTFSIIWTIFLGFGLPTMIVAAYLFEPLNGTIFLVLSKTIGVAIIFFLYKKIFYSYLSSKISFKKINKNTLSKFLKKNELYNLILLRLIPGLPVQAIDILPLIIGVKFKNYILSKFLGSLIPHFLIINFFSVFFTNLDRNLAANLNFSVTKELIIAFLIFGLFIILSNLIKKKINFNKFLR